MATTDIGRVTPIWRGFYSAAATYELNDIVIDTAGSVWWHKSEELTTGVIPEAGEIWDAVIDMSVFSGLIQAAITTAQTALAAAQEAVAEVTADTKRAETAADNAENSAAAASESAAGVGALAQAAERSAEAAAGSATGAAGSAAAAAGSKSDAEAYAVGTRGGEDVETTDPTYHNNAKYYAEQAASEAEAAAQSAEDAQDVLDSIPEDYSQLSADVGDLKTQIGDVDGTYSEIGESITPADNVPRANTQIGDNYTNKLETSKTYKTKTLSITGRKYRVTVRQYANAARPLIMGVDADGLVTWMNATEVVTSTGTVTYIVELPADTTMLSVSSYGNTWAGVIEEFAPNDLQTQINEIKDDIDSLNERVDSIEEDIEFNNNFYATIYHDEEDALVNRVMADKTIDTVTFGLITDTHNGARADRQTSSHARVINRLAERCGAGFIAHLGDVIEGYGATHEENQAYMIDYCSKQNDGYIPTLYTLSHHEQYGAQGPQGWGVDSTALTPEECLSIEGLNKRGLNVVYSSDNANWFVDIYGVRFIGLNSASDTNKYFNTITSDFLSTALTNCELPIVVFSHFPSRSGLVNGGGSAENWKVIRTILNDYNKDIIGFFHGHAHWDNIYKPDSAPANFNPETDDMRIEKFPYICTCCGYMHMSTNTIENVVGNPTRQPRDINGYSRYCFDIVNIHLNTKQIKMFRFGAGSDRTYTPS